MRPLLAAFLTSIVLLPAPVRAESGSLGLRWLGVAGFSISDGQTVLLHDPFLSRPGVLRTLLRRFRPDEQVLARLLAADGPAPEAAAARLVLIGHSHYDHLGDAPWIATRIGARLVGSATSAAIAVGYGLPSAQTMVVAPGEEVGEGAFRIRAVESRHARVLFGRVPFPGRLETPPDAPLHAFSFVLGDARAYRVRHEPTGVRLVLLSSAGLHRPALEQIQPGVDAVLTAIQGREADFARTLVEVLQPRLVVPHHFDSFFRSLEDPRAGEASDAEEVAAFEAEVREAAEQLGLPVRLHRPTLFEPFVVAPATPGP